MTVKIVIDTTACLPRDYIAAHKLPLIPQIIIFGEESFRDDTEIDLTTFLQKLRTSPDFPKTAAPPPALYQPIYEELSAANDTILVLAPSAEVSGTVRSATIAAQDFPGADIRVYDSRTIGGGLASMIMKAVDMAEAGQDADAIIQKMDAMKKAGRIYFLVDTLEYLQKGGRIGRAKSMIGGLLQVKPILTVDDGVVSPFGSQRTHKKGVSYLMELIKTECPRSPTSYLNVMQAEAEEEAHKIAKELESVMGIPRVPVYDLHIAIVVHGGPGVLGFSYFVD